MRPSALIFFGVLGVALAGAGCGGEKTTHPPASETLAAAESETKTKSDPAVASGAGLHIGLDKFEHFLEEHPELGKDEALERLIDRELLVQEALERGLQHDPSLGHVRKRAMVRELLRARVEDEVTKEDLTEDKLAGVIEQVRREVGHPPGVRASHLVVLVPPEKKKKASKKQVEAWFEQSRIWLDRLREHLPAHADALDLMEVRDAFQDKLPEPLEATVNAHMIFPVEATDEYGAKLPETWHTVVPEFRDAAADLARQGRFGELSEPVKTEFGWHVIVAEQALAGKRPDADAVREVARWRLLRHERNARFAELMGEWIEDVQVKTFPEVISEAEELNN